MNVVAVDRAVPVACLHFEFSKNTNYECPCKANGRRRGEGGVGPRGGQGQEWWDREEGEYPFCTANDASDCPLILGTLCIGATKQSVPRCILLLSFSDGHEGRGEVSTLQSASPNILYL